MKRLGTEMNQMKTPISRRKKAALPVQTERLCHWRISLLNRQLVTVAVKQ